MNDIIRLPIDMVTTTCQAVFEARGVPAEHAAIVVDNLVGADRRGIHSHGIARVPMYLDLLDSGAIDPGATPRTEYSAPATSCWDGQRAFGQVVMRALVDHACDQARLVGAHVGVVHGSNHFGYAGHWVRRGADRGAVAMAFTTGGPLVVPTRGRRPELGTNPVAFAARSRRDEIVVDMSTSTVSMGKLELAQRSNEPIPSGWALDGAGDPLTDPVPLLDGVLTGQAGGLLPLGGSGTDHGGHKGYGLGLIVETLAAVLSGGADLRVDKHDADRYTGHVSHCFIALDPAHLAGVEPTQRALNRLVDSMRRSPPLDPDEPVLVPGDPEREWEDRAGAHEVLVESVCWRTLCGLLADVRGAPVDSLPPPSTANRGTR